MIARYLFNSLNTLLDHYPAVALLGPRQVGKTTLALTLAEQRPALYLDLEADADRAKLSDAELYLADHEGKLVILDEVHRIPNLKRRQSAFFHSLKNNPVLWSEYRRIAGHFPCPGMVSFASTEHFVDGMGGQDPLAPVQHRFSIGALQAVALRIQQRAEFTR